MMMGGMGFGGGSARRIHPDEEMFGSVYDQRVVLRLLPYILPFKKLAIISAIAMLIYTGTQVAIPWLIKVGIDEFIETGGSDRPDLYVHPVHRHCRLELGHELHNAVLHGEGRSGHSL